MNDDKQLKQPERDSTCIKCAQNFVKHNDTSSGKEPQKLDLVALLCDHLGVQTGNPYSNEIKIRKSPIFRVWCNTRGTLDLVKHIVSRL